MVDLKKIFKNEILGSPSGEIVLNNEIKGVFGEITNIVPVINETLTSSLLGGTYDVTYNIPSPQTISESVGGQVALFGVVYTRTYSLTTNANTIIVLNYNEPIKNVAQENISIVLNYREYSFERTFQGSVAPPEWGLVYGQISEPIGTQIINTAFGDIAPQVTSIPVPNMIDKRKTINIVKTDIKPYRIEVEFENTTLNGSIKAGAVDATPWGQSLGLTGFYQTGQTINVPLSIEITVVGDTIKIINQAYQIGDPTNALELPANPLVTTKAMIRTNDGLIPLYQYRANKIINEWKDGKQTLSVTKVVNGMDKLSKVGDETIIINAREHDITDENAQSYLKNQDGTAKKFIVTSAEFVYDGSSKQILELQEKKE